MNTKTQPHNLRLAKGATSRLAAWRVQSFLLVLAIFASLGLALNAHADRVNHDVSAGYLKIDQTVPGYYDNTNTTAALLMSVNGLTVVSNVVNMGDYRVQIGSSFTDDTNSGVIIVAVAQNGRANWTNGLGAFTNNFQTPNSIPYPGGYWEAGIFRCPPNATTTANQGEDNVDVTVGYFPFQSWIAGYCLNSVNGGVLSNFVASPGLTLGTHFIDPLATNGPDGTAYLDLRSLGIDSRRDGILLVTSAKNEANYALSRVNNDDDEMDGTWTIYSHDNRANGRAYESDPLGFVFVPKTNTAVVSGMFMGDAAIAIYSGASPAFTVTNFSTGQYELKIPGRSPSDGILIISAAGGDPNNGDNIVTFQKNTAGDGWIIQSRDLPGCGLQTPPEAEAVCSFVFIPAEKPGVTVTPNKNLQTTESGGTAQFTVTVNGYPKPTANVSINLSSSDTTEGTVSPSTLTFTPAEWNTPKQVTITGVDDALFDGTLPYTVNLTTTTSTDTNYNGLVTGSVEAINIDNEAGVSVSASSVVTTESGGTNTFSVWLNTAPTDNVTIGISSSDTTEATVSPTTLTFTPADFATPQVVTVTGVNDAVQDGNIVYTVITAPAVSTDSAYSGYNALDVIGTNLDDDLARVIIPAGKLTISEPNTTASFPVVLSSEPTANVTINLSSSDTSEGTVPASITFTPLNWFTPQNVTVTAVDDLVNDGPIDFSIITTVTSGDAVYAAINPADVNVTTLDNEGDFRLPSGTFTYGIGEPAKDIDGYATINDTDTADYNGGSLVVTITAGGNASDRLDIRSTGSDPTQISVSGTTVSYEGVAIGTKSGGTGVTPLSVSLNGSATPAAAQALARAITYQNVDTNAAPQTRAIAFVVSDGDGGVSTALKNVVIRLMRIDSYQQGADGGFGVYPSALDTQIHHQFPNNTYPAGYSTAGLWIDYDPLSLIPTDQMQCFLKFTNLFGAGPGQIPAGSKIVFAELVMNVTDSGHGARFNRMLIDWDESATFNSMVDGVQLDDVEAVSGTNSFLSDQAANTTTGVGLKTISVTSDLQAWCDGAANYGWVMSTWDGGANGTAFSPCEATNVTLRPKLRVGWIPAAKTSVASFRDGTNGYTGQVDTMIRLTTPDTTFAANAILSPDAAVVAAPAVNPCHVLVRFDNIIGAGVSQIPAGATIHAAILDLTSITADAQGAGGTFNRLLQSWDPVTATWNTWVNGISANNVEAVAIPTATLPVAGQGTSAEAQATRYNVELTADVQAWANGAANNGWAILPWPGGNNGWAFSSAEATFDWRPQLRVYFTANAVNNLVMKMPVVSPGLVQVKFSGSPSTQYNIQRAPSVTGPWGGVGTATTDGSGNGTYNDNSPLPGSAFYRAYP